VLVIALMVTIGVAMLGACLLQFSASTTRSQIQGVDKKRAFYLAEAGLSESMYGLMVGESGNLGTPDNPAKFGDGVFWVEATKSRDGRVMLDSTGLCGSGRASLSIVVEKHGDSSASLGIFSNGDLVVRAGSRIDSYDPGAGLIEGLLGGGSGTAGRVGSNGNIEVQASKYSTTRIEGDVTPGPAGTVTSGTGVTITGSTAPRSAPFTLPAIEVPALASLGDLSHVAHETLTIPTGEHRYGALTVGTGAELLVVGPQTIVASSMVLQNGAKLAFDTSGGAVTIYVTDYMNFGASTTIDNRQHDPAKAHFMVGASQTVDRNGDGIDDPPITFSSTGKLYATIYAPSASLTLGSSLELYGAVTAANLVLSENAKLHFDEALVEDDGTGPGSVKLVSWKVLELPDMPLVGLRLDPVVALRQAGATLLSPVASHQDVEFKIEYIDKCGKDVVWAGEEAKFDWSKVVTVVVVARLTDLLFDAL
jgi:hypothetical protein